MAQQHTDPQMVEQGKNLLDALSVTAVAGVLVGLLPAVAALFTIIWTGLRIYESDTVQGWLERRRQRREGD